MTSSIGLSLLEKVSIVSTIISCTWHFPLDAHKGQAPLPRGFNSTFIANNNNFPEN